jgi:hypothetical protein
MVTGFKEQTITTKQLIRTEIRCSNIIAKDSYNLIM